MKFSLKTLTLFVLYWLRRKVIVLDIQHESIQRFPSKTTIDIMEAVKYNKATVTQVFKALIFPDNSPIFRNTIRKLFNERLQAGREKNASKKQTIKQLLNSIHGKVEQMIRDIKMIVRDDSDDDIENINKYYNEGQVLSDILLANNQCKLEVEYHNHR